VKEWRRKQGEGDEAEVTKEGDEDENKQEEAEDEGGKRRGGETEADDDILPIVSNRGETVFVFCSPTDVSNDVCVNSTKDSALHIRFGRK
jgi:hypothetical protein